MLFLVIFEDDKSGNFLRGDKSFRTLKRAKSRTNDVTSKNHLRHFGASQKLKTDIFVNVIYNFNLPLVKNTGNISLGTCKSCKQTRACALVCLPDLQLPREIFPVFLTKGRLISM